MLLPLLAHPVAGFRSTGWRHNSVDTRGIKMFQVAELSLFSTSSQKGEFLEHLPLGFEIIL